MKNQELHSLLLNTPAYEYGLYVLRHCSAFAGTGKDTPEAAWMSFPVAEFCLYGVVLE